MHYFRHAYRLNGYRVQPLSAVLGWINDSVIQVNEIDTSLKRFTSAESALVGVQ